MKIEEDNTLICDVLESFVKSFGAVGACCFIDFSDPHRWLGNEYLENLISRPGMVYTSDNAKSISVYTRRNVSLNNSDLIRFYNKDVHIWRSIKIRGVEGFEELTKVTLNLNPSSNNELVVRYFIYFPGEVALDSGAIEKIRFLLVPYNEYVLSLASSDDPQLCPMLSYKIIKPKSLKVIRYLSQGLTREQIAERCYLSSRGVDYHLDRLRDVTGAANISSLIYRCTKLLII
ncbi:hypothetical protein KUW19_07720 [Ferrimonas balearica]|uniref:helix-turn-helix transcriptional regulator n=1 Tax=Ferrimonas balearica TaxID=44012 RepID=UPI001C9585E1|nr:hypothetical protein [Ferrimonas balearica]MBY6106382.1 hypothetical protein [Ferrimonas balearica]